MRKIFQLQVLLLSVLLVIPVFAYADDGTTGARILNQPVGARVQGMGEAFTAVADDLSALHYNPAGLGFQEQNNISAMYIRSVSDVYYGFLGGSYSNRWRGGCRQPNDSAGRGNRNKQSGWIKSNFARGARLFIYHGLRFCFGKYPCHYTLGLMAKSFPALCWSNILRRRVHWISADIIKRRWKG